MVLLDGGDPPLISYTFCAHNRRQSYRKIQQLLVSIDDNTLASEPNLGCISEMEFFMGATGGADTTRLAAETPRFPRIREDDEILAQIPVTGRTKARLPFGDGKVSLTVASPQVLEVVREVTPDKNKRLEEALAPIGVQIWRDVILDELADPEISEGRRAELTGEYEATFNSGNYLNINDKAKKIAEEASKKKPSRRLTEILYEIGSGGNPRYEAHGVVTGEISQLTFQGAGYYLDSTDFTAESFFQGYAVYALHLDNEIVGGSYCAYLLLPKDAPVQSVEIGATRLTVRFAPGRVLEMPLYGPEYADRVDEEGLVAGKPPVLGVIRVFSKAGEYGAVVKSQLIDGKNTSHEHLWPTAMPALETSRSEGMTGSAIASDTYVPPAAPATPDLPPAIPSASASASDPASDPAPATAASVTIAMGRKSAVIRTDREELRLVFESSDIIDEVRIFDLDVDAQFHEARVLAGSFAENEFNGTLTAQQILKSYHIIHVRLALEGGAGQSFYLVTPKPARVAGITVTHDTITVTGRAMADLVVGRRTGKHKDGSNATVEPSVELALASLVIMQDASGPDRGQHSYIAKLGQTGLIQGDLPSALFSEATVTAVAAPKPPKPATQPLARAFVSAGGGIGAVTLDPGRAALPLQGLGVGVGVGMFRDFDDLLGPLGARVQIAGSGAYRDLGGHDDSGRQLMYSDVSGAVMVAAGPFVDLGTWRLVGEGGIGLSHHLPLGGAVVAGSEGVVLNDPVMASPGMPWTLQGGLTLYPDLPWPGSTGHHALGVTVQSQPGIYVIGPMAEDPAVDGVTTARALDAQLHYRVDF